MAHLGDFDTSTVIYGKFTTTSATTGGLTAFSTNPSLEVFKDNVTAGGTTGVSLTASFGGNVGLNHYAIDTSQDGTFFASGSFFTIAVKNGTVGGVSVGGYTIASFTLRKSSALKPTTAGRTLDVSSGGEAGIDWANIGSPNTAVSLGGTTMPSVSGGVWDVQRSTKTAAGTFGGDAVVAPANFSTMSITSSGGVTVASLGAGAISANTFSAGAITSSAFASGAITDAAFSAGAITSTTLASSAITAIQASLATAGAVTTANTNISAIKTNTDKMVFTKANELDVNIQSINDTTIVGDGTGTKFGV